MYLKIENVKLKIEKNISVLCSISVSPCPLCFSNLICVEMRSVTHDDTKRSFVIKLYEIN